VANIHCHSHVLHELESDLLGWHFWRIGRHRSFSTAHPAAPATMLRDFLAKSPTPDSNWRAVAPFAEQICEHLRQVDKQTTSRSSQFLNPCRALNPPQSLAWDGLDNCKTRWLELLL
jgi:hypothetical protein